MYKHIDLYNFRPRLQINLYSFVDLYNFAWSLSCLPISAISLTRSPR
ncbi:hypothetical protein EMIT0P218_20476 [Pseudomonas sp. IT-P218]